MEFMEKLIAVPNSSGFIRVRILGPALDVLWGEGSGPQRAGGLIAANRTMFEKIARYKSEAGLALDGIVTITDEDVENSLDELFQNRSACAGLKE